MASSTSTLLSGSSVPTRYRCVLGVIVVVAFVVVVAIIVVVVVAVVVAAEVIGDVVVVLATAVKEIEVIFSWKL